MSVLLDDVKQEKCLHKMAHGGSTSGCNTSMDIASPMIGFAMTAIHLRVMLQSLEKGNHS